MTDPNRTMTPAEQIEAVRVIDAYLTLCAHIPDSPSSLDAARAWGALHPESAALVDAFATDFALLEGDAVARGRPTPYGHLPRVQARERHLTAHLLGTCGCETLSEGGNA